MNNGQEFSGDVNASASYLATGDYYFTTNKFRPFAGVGAGLYSLASANLDDAMEELNEEDLTTGSASGMGIFVLPLNTMQSGNRGPLIITIYPSSLDFCRWGPLLILFPPRTGAALYRSLFLSSIITAFFLHTWDKMNYHEKI